MQLAKRLEKIPHYLFAQIDRKEAELVSQGVDIINLAKGDPDSPTLPRIVQVMHNAIDNPSTHAYPPYQGTKDFREAAAWWMKHRFGVENLDPNWELVSSIGSKEAIHNLFLAFVEEGDYTLIPDPGYPVYRTSTIFVGGEPYAMALKAENNFLPDLTSIPEDIARKSKLLWVNYPNNPTGAIATLEFFEELVTFCKEYDILLCHDHAYSEIAYDNYKPPSVLQIPEAKDIAIEFHSLSKSYNMAGWRIGFVAGNAKAIGALKQVKSNIDSGVFRAIQASAIAAFYSSEEELKSVSSVYQNRREILVQGLRSLGWSIEAPKATLYFWVPVPQGYSSTEFVTLLLDKCGIIVAPGIGYGASGEGFFRIALTLPEKRIQEALQRMRDAGIRYEL
ncbi:aminotransferase class I/II-fold pyridoxal phosphate-dependent enzyme [Scytonema sp. UIC 10036]|uniref:LL-diaminopimelate aminotransferase n=1 Tax=Scytonema sp. UIC 10036 TaxID=2304196 RepID=UPI0012DAAF70|nr:LL-diaminopimelate aminotransferase [Scytonema sp. UIC 10036]MUH01183.1 aminotransferase class I/II-fold pyridoxal phosphate-dependent enzyme [Scytonema sp. UIC 10036]